MMSMMLRTRRRRRHGPYFVMVDLIRVRMPSRHVLSFEKPTGDWTIFVDARRALPVLKMQSSTGKTFNGSRVAPATLVGASTWTSSQLGSMHHYKEFRMGRKPTIYQ